MGEVTLTGGASASQSGSIAARVPLAVVIPAFNEEATVSETIAQFGAELPQAFFVVVDNASTDATAARAAGTLQEFGLTGAVLFEATKGKANAVRRAFLEVDADVYVMVDADCTYDATAVHELLAQLRHPGVDMVVGDRLSTGDYTAANTRRFHDFGNHLVVKLVNSVFEADLVDVMSGYRAMTRRFVRHYAILVTGFELEIDMTVHALDKRFGIVEVPATYRDRPPGSESKLSTFRDGRRVLAVLIHLIRHYRPARFYGSLALVFMVAGVMAGIPPILDYVRDSYVYRVPLAILATGFMLLAAMCLAIALILDSNRHASLSQFEGELLRDRGDDRNGS